MGDEEAPVRTERAWFLSYSPRWGNQRADDPPSLTPITEIRMLTHSQNILTKKGKHFIHDNDYDLCFGEYQC